MRERGRWGFTPAEWDEACGRMRALLLEVARAHATVTYGEAARRVTGGRVSARSGALVALLGEVCEALDEEIGAMSASLVVRADSGIPGEGYFVWIEEHEGEHIADRHAFWSREVERVWDAVAALRDGARP